MTGLLNDLMHERADALERPHVDLDRLVREGDRRVRRRRTALVGAGAAAALVAGFALPAALSGDQTGSDAVDQGLAAAFSAHVPSYAVGAVVHIGDLTLDVGHPVRAYVQTDVGVVTSDAQGRVWSADGASVTEVGRIRKDYPTLEADDALAAWVEPGTDGAAPSFAVLDQSTGEVTHDVLGNVPGMTDLRDDGSDPAVVYAIDAPMVYVRDHTGAVAWNVETGVTELLAANADGFTIDDVENARIAYQPIGTGSPDYRVGPDLSSGRALSVWTAYYLSPSGRYLMAEPETDDVWVLDTTTGEAMPKDDQGYDYFGGYQWIDDEHYAALGLDEPYEKTPVDVLSCEVATGVCTVVAEDVGSLDDGFTMPIGEYTG